MIGTFFEGAQQFHPDCISAPEWDGWFAPYTDSAATIHFRGDGCTAESNVTPKCDRSWGIVCAKQRARNLRRGHAGGSHAIFL